MMDDGQRRKRFRCTSLHNDRGIAAVEFAMVAIPFFGLMFMIFEQGLMFFRTEALQTAISASGRLIATGQAGSAGYTKEQFRQQICASLPPLLSCSSISVDVRTYSSFSAVTRFRPYDANGNYTPAATIYTPGVQGSIVMVTGYSLQRVMFPMLNTYFSNAGSGQVLLTSSAAFRNEPY